jgi:4-hydroxy-2-oxoheptanedioate aldolase
MQLPVNHFKHAIRSGRTQFGLWVALANPVAAEICAASGYDWLVLDAEHGPNDVLTILGQLQAVAPYRAQPVVRPPHADAALIKRYLDVGAQTLLVPMIDTPEQAAALVSASRYPPEGIRGIASMTRAARWTRVPDYLKRAQEEICVIPQIETTKGLSNLEAIAAVPGIDAVFIGPSDLSASMGFLGQPGHPSVVAEIERAIARIKAAGKPVGILSVDEKLARRYAELGCSFVALGVDITLLARAIDSLRERFGGDQPATPAGSAAY